MVKNAITEGNEFVSNQICRVKEVIEGSVAIIMTGCYVRCQHSFNVNSSVVDVILTIVIL